MKKYLVFLISALILTGCNDDFELQGEESPQLVVEGWIEDGGFPIVILTRSLPISTEYRNIDDLSDYILRWAKVTVSDGTDSVVLTGKYDEGYFPPYISMSKSLQKKQKQKQEEMEKIAAKKLNRYGIPWVTVDTTERIDSKIAELLEKNKSVN